MRERIEVPDRLDDVVRGRRGTRDYDEGFAENARKALAQFVTDAGGQKPAAAKLARIEGLGHKLHQSTVQRALEGYPSARILIALSLATGQSIDAMLGLPTAHRVTAKDIATEVAKLLPSSPAPLPALPPAPSTVPPSHTGTRIIKPAKG